MGFYCVIENTHNANFTMLIMRIEKSKELLNTLLIPSATSSPSALLPARTDPGS